MPTQSFYANYEESPIEILATGYQPVYTTLPTGSDDAFERVASIVLVNGVGSNAVVKIKRIHVGNNGVGDSALGSVFSIQDITAMTGGYALTAIPHDTAGATIPAQVTFACQPTVTNGYSVFRRSMDIPLQTPLNFPFITVPFAAGEFQGATDLDSTKIISTGYLDQGQTQAIKLTEGMGIAINNSSALPFTYLYSLLVMFRIGTDTYRICSPVHSAINTTSTLFALMNGSGSGVSIEILKICLKEIGSGEPALWRVARVEDSNFSGNEITPLGLDTTNSIPSQVKIHREQVVQLAGKREGAIIPSPYLKSFQTYGMGTSLSLTSLSFNCLKQVQLDYKNSEIVLQEGEAVAIFKGSSSGVGIDQFELVFNVTTAETSSGGGEHSYAFP
jgi:hypothetical protein